MIRSLRAFLLLSTVLVSYAMQWLLVRLSWGRLGGARWSRVHSANADRLAVGFSRLRGVFIKLGQVISVLGGFLPAQYRVSLSRLQDQVAPRPFAEVERRLEKAFGPDGLRRFAEFDRTPLAAASLAQVHRAKLHNGRTVAVKVLYPGIERLIARDLFVLGCFLPIVNWVFPVVRFDRVLSQLAAMLTRETDYTNERRNMERLRVVFADRQDIVVPEVEADLTSKAVLTMTFQEGVRIGDVDALRAQGIEPEAVARLLADSYFTMLFQHRVLHADPHPGNFLVRKGPQLIILDYGAVEDVSQELVDGLTTVLVGAVTRNAGKVLDGAEEMGFIAPGGNRDLLRSVGRKYLESLGSVQIEDFSSFDRAALQKMSGYSHIRGRMREVMRSVQYPEGYFYLERTLALLFGLVGQLEPRRGLPGVAAPLASKIMLRRLAGSAPRPPTATGSPRPHKCD